MNSWETKKLRIVAVFSTDSECIAFTEAAKEAMYLRNLLQEVEVKYEELIIFWNESTVRLHFSIQLDLIRIIFIIFYIEISLIFPIIY